MTKYATERQYRPYIDRAMLDLNLTGHVHIEWKFKDMGKIGGDAVLYDTYWDKGIRLGAITIHNRLTKRRTIEIILHELRHIDQYLSGKLRDGAMKVDGKWVGAKTWEGVTYRAITFQTFSQEEAREYNKQPWEADAIWYEGEVDTLFPNLEVVKIDTRQYIGNIGKVKFYKVKG